MLQLFLGVCIALHSITNVESTLEIHDGQIKRIGNPTLIDSCDGSTTECCVYLQEQSRMHEPEDPINVGQIRSVDAAEYWLGGWTKAMSFNCCASAPTTSGSYMEPHTCAGAFMMVCRVGYVPVFVAEEVEIQKFKRVDESGSGSIIALPTTTGFCVKEFSVVKQQARAGQEGDLDVPEIPNTYVAIMYIYAWFTANTKSFSDVAVLPQWAKLENVDDDLVVKQIGAEYKLSWGPAEPGGKYQVKFGANKNAATTLHIRLGRENEEF